MIKAAKNKMFSSKLRMTISITVVALLVIALVIFLLVTTKEELVAKVDGTPITKKEFQARVNEQAHFFNQARQSYDETVILEQTKNNLIDEKIIKNYATRKNISVSEDEIKQRFSAVAQNRSSEKELIDELKSLYGKDKASYLTTLQNDLLREKVSESIDTNFFLWLSQQRNIVDIEYITK